jgi:hypothetical protein
MIWRGITPSGLWRYSTWTVLDGGHFWPIVPAPGDCEDGGFGGMKTDRGNRSTRGENLAQRHFIHLKSHLTKPGCDPGPPRWEASDWPLELWRSHQTYKRENRLWLRTLLKIFKFLNVILSGDRYRVFYLLTRFWIILYWQVHLLSLVLMKNGDYKK